MSMDCDMDDERRRYLTKLYMEWVPVDPVPPSPPPAPSPSEDVDGRHADVSTLWPKDIVAALTDTDPDEPDPRQWACGWRPVLEHLFPQSEGYVIYEYHPLPTVPLQLQKKPSSKKRPIELLVGYRGQTDAPFWQTVAFLQIQSPQRLDDRKERIRVDKKMRDRFVELFRADDVHHELAVGLSALGPRIALYASTHEVKVRTAAQQRATGVGREHYYLDITPYRRTQKGGVGFEDEPELLHDRCPRYFWARHVCSDEGYRMMQMFRDHVRDSVGKHLAVERPSPSDNESMLVDEEIGEDSRPESVTGADDMDEN